MKRSICCKVFLRKLVALFWDRERQSSYSQEGEDRILMRLFEYSPPGFYVDIGAHHPRRFSNTCIFYRRGWRGINVDATPGSMFLFRFFRRRDVNLEVAVGAQRGELTFYEFDEPALNTFDPELARQRTGRNSPLIGTPTVKMFPLSDILAEHLPENTPISFLTVDVEGLDLQVLKSNDWSRFRPRYVLAEALGNDGNIQQNPIAEYMASVGYRPCCSTPNTMFYKDLQAE